MNSFATVTLLVRSNAIIINLFYFSYTYIHLIIIRTYFLIYILNVNKWLILCET